MNKNEIIKDLVSVKDVTQEEANTKYIEFEKDAKDFGFKTDLEIEDYIKRRFNSYLSKSKIRGSMTPIDCQIIPIGVRMNDFGAQREYTTNLEAFEKNPEKAVELGYVDSKGIPIFRKSTFNKGEIIDVVKSTRKEYLSLVKKEGETVYSFNTVILNGDNLNKTLSTFSVLKGTLGQGQKNLFYTEDTQIEVIKTLSVSEVQKMAESYFKRGERFFDVNELKTFMTGKTKEELQAHFGFDGYILIKGDVTVITITDKKNDLLVINDSVSDNPEVIKAFVSKDLFNIDFNEKAMDIYLVGIPKLDDNGDMNLPTFGSFGFFRDERYKIIEQPKPVTPEPEKAVEPEPEVVFI